MEAEGKQKSPAINIKTDAEKDKDVKKNTTDYSADEPDVDDTDTTDDENQPTDDDAGNDTPPEDDETTTSDGNADENKDLDAGTNDYTEDVPDDNPDGTDDNTTPDDGTDVPDDGEEKTDDSPDDGGTPSEDDSTDGASGESDADKKNNEIILLRNFIHLSKVIDNTLKKISEARKDSVLAAVTYSQVTENLEHLSTIVYRYILMYYDNNEYSLNLYNYKYFIEIMNLNLEMLKKVVVPTDKEPTNI